MHDAFTAALERWPREGVPDEPARVARLDRAIQGDRPAAPRRARFDASRAAIAEQLEATSPRGRLDEDGVEDDRLRLIFTCCHPALRADAQIALTLREVCGLDDRGDRARVPDAAADARAAHRAREGEDPRRAHSRTRCRRVPSCPIGSTRCCTSSISFSTRATPRPRATSLTRHDLSGEAIRLGRLLVELLPEPEAIGPARADAAARLAARGARRRRTARSCCSTSRIGRSGIARRSHEGAGARRARAPSRRVRPLHAAGGDRRGACAGARRRGDGLGADRRPVRRAVARRAVAGGRAQPRRRPRDARRPAGGACPHRRDPGARRAHGLSPRPLGPRRSCRRLGRTDDASPRTSARWRSRSRRRNAVSSNGGWQSCGR